MSSRVVGRNFITDISTTLEDNDDWTVVVQLIEKRLVEGKEWEQKVIAAQCTDTSSTDAFNVAMKSATEQFNDLMQQNQQESMFPAIEEEA